ncbi:hypothetical protein CLOM_g13755 [Closterium sp. NIES-68]|nr:hypothetical protein CLOM_g13755 [Closterium sp. NIES-68]
MEECGKCGERAVDYDEQALALVCARCGHVADDAQLTSRVEFDESGRAGGVRVGGGGGAGDGGEPRSWMWTAGAGGGRFGGGWGEGTAETKWGGGGKSAEFKRRKNKREWEERLGAVVAGLRVPEGVRGEAVEVAERVLEGRWGGGQWMGVLMAAAVYIAARNRRLPVSMAEVAHATDCQLASVWAMFKRLLAYFPMLQPEHVDPISHVWRGVHAMPSLAGWQGEGGKQALVRDAMRLLAFAHSHSLHTGRHAAPMAAAALLLVAAARGVVLGEAQLCAAMAVPPATVRRRFSELVPALSRLARSLHLPAAAHATSQEAFQRLLPSILALLPSPARVGHRFVMPSAGDHSADVDRNADVDKNAGLDRSGDVGRRATVEDKAAEGPAPGCVLQSSFAGGERAGRGNGAAQAGAVQGLDRREGGDGCRGGEDGAALEPREGHAVCANQLLPPAFEDSVKAHQRRAGHISRAQQRLQQTKRDRWGRAGRRGAVGGVEEGGSGESGEGRGKTVLAEGKEGAGGGEGGDEWRMEVLWRWEAACVDDKGGEGGKRVRRSMRSFGEGGGGVGAKGRQEQGGGSEDAVVDWLLLQQSTIH